MRLVKALFVAAALLASSAAQAQGLPPVAAKVGKWEFRKGSDGFSGKASCLLTLAANPRVQLSDDALYISYRGIGGLRGYKLRLDEGPATDMILPTSLEEQTNMIEFTGAKFNRVMQAKRLRVQTVTYFDLKNEDIDLAGAAPLLARMRREC
jgi:hypothetical protein